MLMVIVQFLVTSGQVQVVALSSYEEKEEQFKEQVPEASLVSLKG